ncbi:MAG: tRNA (cytidine(34)-2'-O)-methyltransferase, partial [Burkholderiaceae bacterium]
TESPQHLFAFTTKARRHLFGQAIEPGSFLVFGSETRGLPENILQTIGQARSLRLPMVANSRSLNLSNAVAVGVYEAWRQQHCDEGQAKN